VLGVLGWILAAQGYSILGLMLAACNACMCGLLGPVLASRLLTFLNLPPASASPRMSAAAVACGALCGLSPSLAASAVARLVHCIIFAFSALDTVSIILSALGSACAWYIFAKRALIATEECQEA
jgi:hypothetical protein